MLFLCSAVCLLVCLRMHGYTYTFIYMYIFKNKFQKWKLVLKYFIYRFLSFEDLMGNFHFWESAGWRSSFFFFFFSYLRQYYFMIKNRANTRTRPSPNSPFLELASYLHWHLNKWSNTELYSWKISKWIYGTHSVNTVCFMFMTVLWLPVLSEIALPQIHCEAVLL